MSARRNTNGRALGVALALLFLGGQLSGLTHQLLVRHVTCAEHGELIHADERVAHSAPVQGPAVSEAEAGPAHQHEHCLASVSRREKLIPAVSVSALPSLAPPRFVAFVAPGQGALCRLSLLRLAPKSSPPV
jgi:hypothetical protein